MKVNFLYSLLIFVFINCKSTQNIQDPNILSVSLHHQSEARDAKLTLFPSHYTMQNYGELFQYDLNTAKWLELNKILDKISINELSNYEAPEVNGRLVERNLTSQITIERKDGTYTSQSFVKGNIPTELVEIFEFLNSFFPLN